jgi:hypothetical protein
MAGTLKRTFGPLALTNTYTTNVYNNASALIYDLIWHFHIANKGVAVATFRLFLGATGANAAGTEVFFDTPPGGIAVGSYFDFYPARGIKLTSTDFLVGGASLATTLTIMAEGEQFVV